MLPSTQCEFRFYKNVESPWNTLCLTVTNHFHSDVNVLTFFLPHTIFHINGIFHNKKKNDFEYLIMVRPVARVFFWEGRVSGWHK